MNKIIIVIVFLLVGGFGCKKELERDNPNDINGTSAEAAVLVPVSADVTADLNGNKELSANEEGTVSIKVSNTGGRVAQIQSVSISCTDVNFLNAAPIYTTVATKILAHSTAYVTTAELSLKDNVTAGTKIRFEATITETSGKVSSGTVFFVAGYTAPSVLVISDYSIKGFDPFSSVQYTYSKGLSPFLFGKITNNSNNRYDGSASLRIVSQTASFPYDKTFSFPDVHLLANQVDDLILDLSCLDLSGFYVADNTSVTFKITIADNQSGMSSYTTPLIMRKSTSQLTKGGTYLFPGDEASPGNRAKFDLEFAHNGTSSSPNRIINEGLKVHSSSPLVSNLSLISDEFDIPKGYAHNTLKLEFDVAPNAVQGQIMQFDIEYYTQEDCRYLNKLTLNFAVQ